MRPSRLVLILAAAVVFGMSCGKGGPGAERGAGTQAGGETAATYAPDMEQCGGFTARDASGIVGIPAVQLTSKSQRLYEGVWTCSFMVEDGTRGVSFTVTVKPSVAEAVEDMAQYRAHLEVAGETPRYKDLPSGAYSDLSGLGDEAIWTEVNGSLTVRKGNITIQVQMPHDKADQIKVVEAFLTKL
jgi:hypothetical protein